eukprot:scaffold5289_cov107-Cylindrotheca_fusiformis.AAC.5
MSRLYHPDYNHQDPGAREEWFHVLQHAYEKLMDAEYRTSYDRYLKDEEKEEETHHQEHERWNGAWEHCREQQQYSSWYSHNMGQDRQADGSMMKEQKLEQLVESLRAANAELKKMNNKLWDQVSCSLAKEGTLRREVDGLRRRLQTAQNGFCHRELEYKTKIGNLKQQVASLQKARKNRTERTRHNSRKRLIFQKVEIGDSQSSSTQECDSSVADQAPRTYNCNVFGGPKKQKKNSGDVVVTGGGYLPYLPDGKVVKPRTGQQQKDGCNYSSRRQSKE